MRYNIVTRKEQNKQQKERKKMKIRSSYVKVSYAVRVLAKKWNVNPRWVWDVFEDRCGMIKGCGNLANQEEIDSVEYYICGEIMHGRA